MTDDTPANASIVPDPNSVPIETSQESSVGATSAEVFESGDPFDLPDFVTKAANNAGPSPKPTKKAKRRNRVRLLAAILVTITLFVGVGFAVTPLLAAPIGRFMLWVHGGDDYPGPGTGSTQVTIDSGDYGDVIAGKLADAGVVASATSFYKYLLALADQPVFIPGTYSLQLQMSNAGALAALLDQSNRVETTITIPEGYSVDQIFAKLEAIGFSQTDLDALRKDPSQFGLPAAAIDLEGFLFPATYSFDPGTTAKDAIQTMVNRTFKSLDSLGVSASNRLNVVILASIIQKEAGSDVSDMAKISRVFQNRLGQGMLLQSDATVAYGTGRTDSVWTTSAERADSSNIFNTYVHKGLPPGAISNPGDDALSASINPASGDWLYFVVVNLNTGETVFSDTAAQHAAAVQQLADWCNASSENRARCDQ